MQSPDKERSKHKTFRPKRLIKYPHQSSRADSWHQHSKPDKTGVDALPTAALPAVPATPRQSLWENELEGAPDADIPGDELEHDPDAGIPSDLFDVGSMSTMRLMQVSSMMRAISLPLPAQSGKGTIPAVEASFSPYSAQQRDALAVSQPYGSGVFGKTQSLPRVASLQGATQEQAQPTWKIVLNNPAVKTVLGLLIGIGMLFLISRFVDVPTTVSVLRQHLTTIQGGIYALLAAASFIAAFSLRGARWQLFLSRICDISTLKAIQVFWVAVFLNFLLPVQGGEVAKSLILKQIKRVPISQSLPTVAMDKSLDLMPALFIISIVPFIPGIHMSATLWIILSLVSGILLGIIFTVVLMAWNRVAATKFIQLVLKILPRPIGGKIEGFALGFIDSLLAGASRPKTFIPAVLLTCLAVLCDGFFAWFAFLTVGVSKMSFGTAIFGYTTYVMFSILPNPPGQVGSNELAGVLVFGGLLGFPRTDVLAMFVFSHPLAALIMTTMSMLCLSALGISLTSAMKVTAPKGPKDDGPQATHKGQYLSKKEVGSAP